MPTALDLPVPGEAGRSSSSTTGQPLCAARPARPRRLPSLGALYTLCTWALFGLAGPAAANSTIVPVIIDIPVSGRTIVKVTNNRDRPVMYQIAAKTWQVIDGKDRYETTEDFIASPPLFTLDAAATQEVRIGMRNPVPAPLERAYRLVVAEVPRVRAAGEEGSAVEFAFQYLLPVYVASADRNAKAELHWSLQAAGDAVMLRAENGGQKRVALTALSLFTDRLAAGEPDWKVKELTTVLAGTWREWRIAVPPGTASMPWHIVIRLQGSAMPMVVPDADIVASGPR